MLNSKLVNIIRNGCIAAIYIVLTIFNPLAFGLIQVRIAEILCLLCFYKKDYFVGVTIGCVISNVVSKVGIWDMLIGGSATLLSCLFIGFVSPRLWVGCLVTIILNSIFVGFEISFFLNVELAYSIAAICISETITLIVGYLLFYLLRNRKDFFKLINANQHLIWKW